MSAPGGYVTGRVMGLVPAGTLAEPDRKEPGAVGSAHAVPSADAAGSGPWRSACGRQVDELRGPWTPGRGLGGGPWCPACQRTTGG